MTLPIQRQIRDRSFTDLPEDTTTARQPRVASAQFREPIMQSQSHIRPGADLTQEPTDAPDTLLVKFLKSNETYQVDQPSDPRDARKTSQGLLREILADKRWTRRMVEDFYKDINPSVGGLTHCLTPYPFHRTLYLFLLNALEDNERVMKETEDGYNKTMKPSEAEMGEVENQARTRIAQGSIGGLNGQKQNDPR